MATSNRTGAGRAGPRRLRAAPDLAQLGELSGRVTAIQVQEKAPHRRSVYLNEEFAVGLDAEVVVLARLKVGEQIDGPALVALVLKDQEKRAWDSALVLLSAAARTRREVQRRLTRTYAPETAQRVVERLAAGGWLDDAALAGRYVAAHPEFGERRLLGDLLRRGVAREEAMAAVSAGVAPEQALEGLREVAARRLSTMAGIDRQTAHRRLAGFLARRGYDYETIATVLGPLLADLPPAPRPGVGKRSGRGKRFAAEEGE